MPVLQLCVASASLAAGPAAGPDGWPKLDDLHGWLVEQSRRWAEQSCGKGWVLGRLLAEDFLGTSPAGKRYSKPKTEPDLTQVNDWHEGCRLLGVEVRMFSPEVAVVYGTESKWVPVPGSGSQRRCLAWTDTWLMREGQWQIIAAHDNRIDCPPDTEATDPGEAPGLPDPAGAPH